MLKKVSERNSTTIKSTSNRILFPNDGEKVTQLIQ